MMKFKSIQWSMNSVHVVAMILICPVSIYTFVQLKKNAVIKKADFKLSRDLNNILTSSSTPELTLKYPENWYIHWGSDGTIVSRSPNSPHISPPQEVTNKLEFSWIGDQRVHFQENPEKKTLYAVGTSEGPIKEKIYGTLITLSSLCLIVLPFVVYIAIRKTKKALHPIKQITQTAAAIRDGDFRQRINSSSVKIELEGLTCILNEAFAHIDNTLEIQRKFTSNASHELRTPISILILELESALRDKCSEEDLKERLNHCIDATKKIKQLADELLQIARLESETFELPLEVADVDLHLRIALNELIPLTESKQIALKHNLEKTQGLIAPKPFAQVIRNLISNAVSHTPNGGTITVDLANDKDGNIKITVADTGQGIPQEALPHIFDRLYRADNSRSDHSNRFGLGLSICRSIIIQHNGTISGANRPPHGALFTITLPAI